MKTVLLVRSMIGVLLIGIVASCSKNEPNAEPSKASNSTPPKEQQAAKKSESPLKLDNLWIMQKENSVTWILELENRSGKPIKAFMATCSVLDDLDKVLASKTIEYTSDTGYSSKPKEQAVPGHLISNGDRLCLQIMDVAGQARAQMEQRIMMQGLSEEQGEAMKKKVLDMLGMGTTAYSKDQIQDRAFLGLVPDSQQAKDAAQKELEASRVTKRITFEIEKIVNAE